MAIASQFENVLLLMDDLKARKIVKALKLHFTGIIGILIEAKNQGEISSIKPVIEKILQTNFRINQKIIDFALLECGEL